MDVSLNFKKTKPTGSTVITAFPGFGLVGLISTEFLIDHLNFEKIGQHWFEELPATVAIHESKTVAPIGIFYNSEHNIILVHSISATPGMEWKAAELVMNVAAKVKAKEIICLDGVGTAGDNAAASSNKTFYYSVEDATKKKMDKNGIELLKEGIILGVCPALLLKSDLPVTALFAETESNLPDSAAAARLVDVLDKHLEMGVDSKPLLEMAAKFEEKLKKLVTESKKIQHMQDNKELSYMG